MHMRSYKAKEFLVISFIFICSYFQYKVQKDVNEIRKIQRKDLKGPRVGS